MRQRTIEIFSAGCPLCQEVVDAVRAAACPSCAVTITDLRDPAVGERARAHGVKRAPSVVVAGVLADCCRQGVDRVRLGELGLGRPTAEGA